MSTPVSKIDLHPDASAGVLRWTGQMIAALIIFGSILFLAAGRIDWRAGWSYLGLNAFTQFLSAIVLIPRRPDILAERSRVREGTKAWDHVLAPAITILGTLAVLIVAGLDARFAWTGPFSGGLWGAGLFFAFASQMFVLWAMASNPFFALTVRIQHERGHNVVQHGPYRVVRHPGYLGSVIYNLVIPLALASWWTFIPALLTIALLVFRTALEDRALRAELPGYQEYSRTVPYRLVPGMW